MFKLQSQRIFEGSMWDHRYEGLGFIETPGDN